MTFDTRGRQTTEPSETQSDASSSGDNGEASPEKLMMLMSSFPVLKLRILAQKISNPRWVVPVLPEQELECVLNAAIELTIAGIDHEYEPCVQFYRDALTTSFSKILTDEAVNSWKYNIHHCILLSCGKLLHLIAIHMKRDNPYLLDLLAMVLDPDNKFNTFNAARQPECFGPDSIWGVLDENQMFAKCPPEPKSSRGWLVDLINRFGQLGGFDNLLERFNAGVALLQKPSSPDNNCGNGSDNVQQIGNVSTMATASSSTGGHNIGQSISDDTSSLSSRMKTSTMSSNGTNSSNTSILMMEDSKALSLPLIYALLLPFGQCYELLTIPTIEKYFMPIWEVVLDLLDNLSDDELKREAKPEGRSDYINGIVKSARCLASRLPNQENLIRDLEMFRLKMILRLLQVSSFNGKMNALNEINKVLTSVAYYSHRTPQLPHCLPDDEMDWLTAERMAAWIKETDVLGIVLKDSLHQPQYVEKLEKILRFLIKERALTLEDLDALWRAQAGKHEAIVKNVHDLLAKLAWDFNPEQLDHLFDCFQASMTTANKRQRERLLELIRRLAEDDKNGVMAHKVLKLFWTLAHSAEVPPEVLDQALASHVKILDYSCSQERDAQKTVWLDKCVEELKSGDTWALPALRLIREICCLYEATSSHTPRTHQTLSRQQVIERLQNDHSLVILVTNSLTAYMDKIRTMVRDNPDLKPNNICIDGRYHHTQQIQERLDFLKFLLKDGQLWLCADQAKQIWHCLAVNAVFPSDREECFRWFGKLMGEEPDLDPGINKDFFENNLLQLDPQLLTESGIKCFERFFKAVNSNEDKLKAIHRGYMLDNEDLIGKDYLWRVITTGEEEIANKAIELLKEVSTALGPRLQANICEFHEMFIGECCDRLKTHYDNVLVLSKTIDNSISDDPPASKDVKLRFVEALKMCRIVKVLQEYIKECDRSFTGDRFKLPLSRASRGKHVNLYIRFQNPGRPIDDMEVTTHSNETVAAFKRSLLKRIKGTSAANIKVDLYYNNGEIIEITDDRNALSQYNIRDKMLLTAKLTPVGTGLASSPDSSSDSSTGSPPRPCPDMQRPESEVTLPGVIISQKPHYIEFFLKIYQLGSDLQNGQLRESARALLHLLPLDRFTVKQLQTMCRMRMSGGNEVLDQQQGSQQIQIPTPESIFLHASSAQVLYNLEILHAILMPAIDPLSDMTLHTQSAWLHSGVAHFILELLTKNNFLPNADMHTKRAAFQCVLRLAKLFLHIVGCVLSRVGDEPLLPDFDGGGRSQVDILKQVLNSLPGSSEHTMRAISTKLAENLATEMLSASPEGGRCRMLFCTALQWSCPDLPTIKAIVSLAWAASYGNLHMLGMKSDFSEDISMPESQDFAMCKEALEVLTISLVLNPSANEALSKDPIWPKFITSLVLINPSRHVRQVASEQLFLSCTYCAADRRPFAFMIRLLVSSLQTLVPQYASTCAEFFQLLCRTLNYGCMWTWPLSLGEGLLTQEIMWLRTVRDNMRQTGDTQVHEDLLEGHLCLAKELMFYLFPETKSQLNDLILELVDDFLFPASREYLHLREHGHLKDCTRPPPVCRSPHTIAAACDLLIALCQSCVPNMTLLVETLIDMFCWDTEPLREWEYLPPVGPRPPKGFCGLKNAGATCYMNSVLQQLYMVPSIRMGILQAEGAAIDEDEDFSGEVESMSSDHLYNQDDGGNNRRNYHVGILKYVQAIFAHLGHSALQYYVPRGLWTHFKLQGEPVNLREQQDAVEFFMSLFESLDEGLKALGHNQLMGATLGGCFSDQKICQGCPHRYSKEEPFSVFSVDIRNHSSLTESLEQYVKGELLEGADAYHCDKCDKKVVTVKRLCVRKLPPVLAIQLKRFEYDYERVCAIKFNDYFEFPRILDMEPYTVSGLAKLEGEVIELEENTEENTTTKYELTGIVVHSGQASGGHYFSYILHKDPVTGKEQWYKFDDGEVSECKMHEDEEMKAQCFGGDYMGEVYDNNLKRMQYRRQKRWWNAYMLFYTRCDQKIIQTKPNVEQLSLAESRNFVLPMPKPIEKSVRTQNIRFLHSRSLFSLEFFNFIRKLVSCSVPPSRIDKFTPQTEELSLLGVQLASRFLFHSGFKTKKSLRGAAIDWYDDLKLSVHHWYDTLSHHIRNSSVVRRWFANNALLNPPTRLGEYILVAPAPEVRTVFVKLVVFFCHFAINDEPIPAFEGSNLCEQILICVLKLLKNEVADHGKHLPHYFSLFSMYAGLGIQEKHQLLKLNVPAIFMQVALDEGPGPPIKYQYPELSKLHQVVSHLVRCSDISSRCQSSNNKNRPLPNPFREPNVPIDSLVPLSPEATEYLFGRTSYVKKLIEDTNVGEDGLKLLQYCSWENPHFSRSVLTELLWQCGFTYWHDMRHHTDLLLNILLMEDSWQNHRIHNALMGVAEEREGLLDTIQRAKTHYQKRAYQIIKCLVSLFRQSRVAHTMLNTNQAIARHWTLAVEWLQDELERQRNIGCQYNYSWSPPAQSNDNTNGYMLERSLSAKNTLSMAFELCPEEEQEEANESDVEQIDETAITTTATTVTSTTITAVTATPTLRPQSATATTSTVISDNPLVSAAVVDPPAMTTTTTTTTSTSSQQQILTQPQQSSTVPTAEESSSHSSSPVVSSSQEATTTITTISVNPQLTTIGSTNETTVNGTIIVPLSQLRISLNQPSTKSAEDEQQEQPPQTISIQPSADDTTTTSISTSIVTITGKIDQTTTTTTTTTATISAAAATTTTTTTATAATTCTDNPVTAPTTSMKNI